ncbi:hypothetical protein K432DRAFT_402774 [Lepidopterella palustris CBS 459.81]|uniref:Uncharacterized protein n=1 Tax=Lepidopterella palustris CBS 459.81 TaxID=1314670 RepID=A0A8E2EF25_9PEZI|nr:hypothetical protein K432DRAFT_402774 [Lepidopterella palustris CBS 459.81]
MCSEIIAIISDAFTIDTTIGSFLQFTVLGKSTTDCEGSFSVQMWNVHGGMVSYPVNITGNKVTLQPSWKDDEFMKLQRQQPLRVIGGFYLAATDPLCPSSFLSFGGAVGVITSAGLPANEYLNSTGQALTVPRTGPIPWTTSSI